MFDCAHCDHVEEEHEEGFMRPCSIPGCYCLDFEAKEEEPD